MTTIASTDTPVESQPSWRDRMRQAPATSNSQYSSRDAIDGGYIPECRANGGSRLDVDGYDEFSSRSLGIRQAERAWRQDSPMQQHTQEQEQPLPGWKESSYSQPQSTASFVIEEQNAYNFPYMPPKEQVLQIRPPVQPQQLSWASSGNAPSPRRPMNFSRPRRAVEESSPVKTRDEITTLPDADEDENSYRDRQLEERLRRLELKNTSRARMEDKPRLILQPQSQPPQQYQQHQQQLLQPPPPQSRTAQIPHSAKSAYSRPTLSPIPSAASAVTLSQLRRLREVPEEEDSAEDDYNIPDGTTPTPTYNKANTVQPNASASSSATSFASQVSPVPLSHYPAGTIPLFEQEHNPVDRSFQQATQAKQINQPPKQIIQPTSSRPPIATNRSDEAPIPMHIPTDSTSTTRTFDTTAARSSTGDPASNRTSATSSSQPSSQPSMDVDRITSIPSNSNPTRPLSNHSTQRTTPFMIDRNRPLLSHQNSTASSSTTNGPPNSLSSLAIVRPMRTNSTTSSGATSAMEAFKASNYDISSLSESQIAKLKKKGIDPALYMEMKAATGGLAGKDGKKRSKWTRALVGNTFIG